MASEGLVLHVSPPSVLTIQFVGRRIASGLHNAVLSVPANQEQALLILQNGGVEKKVSTSLSLDELIEYTDWERSQWNDWLRQHGDQVLAIPAGPHGDGRFQSIGDLVRHIFSAEKRYVDRLSNRPLTDTGSIPNDSVDALFQFGRQSRAALKQFVQEFPATDWDAPQEFTLMNNSLTATPRKIIVHVLMHEIRHWAQIATLLRLSGRKGEFHDFLFSPVLGGEFKRSQN